MEGRRLNEFLRSTVGARAEEEAEVRDDERPSCLVLIFGEEDVPSMVTEPPLLRCRGAEAEEEEDGGGGRGDEEDEVFPPPLLLRRLGSVHDVERVAWSM